MLQVVAVLHVHGHVLTVLVPAARADGEDAAALRLLLRRIRKHDAADRLLLFLEDLDDQAVTKRLQVHTIPPPDLLLSVTLALSRGECQTIIELPRGGANRKGDCDGA